MRNLSLPCCCVTIFVTFSSFAFGETLLNRAEQVNRVLWSRFIGPHGIMYDYVGRDGAVILPTPEECEKSMPNALGWWTPIENGGFFNGIYLLSQCMRYENDRTPENREKVNRLVQGLYKLQDVGRTPGFIARGVGSDGKCHYVASSDDQNFPFLLGLWRYLQTDIPTDEQRKECRDRIIRHIEIIRKNDWVIIGDRPNFDRADWKHTDYHSAVYSAMTVRIMAELTGDEDWRKLYRNWLGEDNEKGRQRRESIKNGPTNLAHWSAWFYSNCQYTVAEMLRTETDPALKEIFHESLKNSARNAVKLIGSYKNYDPADPGEFTPDWHGMMPPYREQANSGEAVKMAMEQIKVWNRACPAIAKEKSTLKPAVCAAWIVSLSGDEKLIEQCLPEIRTAVNHFDYDKMHYAAFFYVENLVYTIQISAWKP